MRKSLSLYVHIPFCNSKCIYCNFVSKVGNDFEKNRYVNCLIEEIKLRARVFNPQYQVGTIYIGGGTPSCMDTGVVKRVLNTIFQFFTVENQAEITVEVNPESVTEEKLYEYKNNGVNRISIGLQCSQNNLLEMLGRKHKFSDFSSAVALAKKVGFTNISSDIMIGLPNQNAGDIKETLSKISDMDIKHVSAYMLSIEDNTPLKKLVEDKKLSLPSEKDTIMMYQQAVKSLAIMGFNRYEVSNFSKIGYRSRHNMVYWNRGDYLGLGISAHSFVDGSRLANTSDLKIYCDTIEKLIKPPVESAERVSNEEAKEEFVMLSLRLVEGIDSVAYEKEFGENFFAAKKEQLAKLIKLGLLVIDGDNVRATDAGFMVLNKVIEELLV